MEIRFIDLFAGVGGFRLGLERASNRYKCIWSCELDRYCRRVYRKQFQDEFNTYNITNADVSRIPSFNLLCAGFPCQSFSIAGKREGFNDTRGTLFFEICRVLQAKRPWMLLLENVRGLLSHDEGKTFQTILRHLDELGYDCQWEVLNSKNFGVPQNRERVFIIGHLRGEPRFQVFPIGESGQELNERITTKQVVPALQSPGHACGNYKGMSMIQTTPRVYDTGHSKLHTPDQVSQCLEAGSNFGGMTNNIPYIYATAYTKSNRTNSRIQQSETYPCLDGSKAYGIAWRTRSYMNQEGHFEIRKDDIANQLTTVEKDSMTATPSGIRRLTPLECERLQSFPDNWTLGVSETQRYKMMGNAVTVNVIQAIGERILEGIDSIGKDLAI